MVSLSEMFSIRTAVWLRRKAKNLRRRAEHSNPILAKVFHEAADDLDRRADNVDPTTTPFPDIEEVPRPHHR